MEKVSVGRAFYLLSEKRKLTCIEISTNLEYVLLRTIYGKNYVVAKLGDNDPCYLKLDDIEIFLHPKEKAKKEPNKKGFVYLIEDKATGLKIGESKHPIQRLREIRTGNPDAQILATIESDDCKRLETLLHEKFAKYRYKGEYFRKESEILDYFNAELKYDLKIAPIELFLPREIWDLIETEKPEVYKLAHAVRLNGIVDVWYRRKMVVDLKNTYYHECSTYAEMATMALQILKREVKKEAMKKTGKGRMSYQEFKNNMRQ